jgi:CRISPR/Cas system CSM-associated protein Csm3 (group 7 of RAMP superfamily)
VSTVALIRATLRLTEPGAVAVPAPPSLDNIDLAVDRDPAGRPHLPATTLAGGLRAMTGRYGGQPLADRLFGRLVDPDPTRDTVDAVASPIWVLGSRLLPDDDARLPDTTVRAITAIDRRRGAAANQTLHREEVLPAGSRLEMFLRWDDPSDTDLRVFLAHLRHWRPLIGHAVTRGRGSAVIDDIGHTVLDLHRPDHLTAWLRGHGPQLLRDLAIQTPPPPPTPIQVPPDPPRLQVPIRIDGPLRVGTGEAEPARDGGPQIARIFKVGNRVVLPGSGLKGLLRSHCEYILRSVDADPLPCLDQRCARCWPCAVFGHGGGDDQDRPGVGQRGVVRVLDAEVAGAVEVTRTHVAIDRFTGGARDNHLFTVQAVEAGTFTLTIDLLDPTDSQHQQIRALLRLVLADLADGLLGVGAAVARGYGSVTPDLTGTGLPTVDEARAVLSSMLSEGAHP